MAEHSSVTGMAFGNAGGRNLVAAFDGGLVTSDTGALLLGATDRAIRLVDRFASCFRDGRLAASITHEVRTVDYDAKRNGFKQSGFARLFQAL